MFQAQPASNTTTYTHNLGLIYRLVAQTEHISRLQLAQITGLTTASLTKLARVLIERRLIQEISAQKSTGGRRAINLAATPEKHWFLALDIQASKANLQLLDLAAQPQAPAKEVALSTGPAQALVALVEHVKAYRSEHTPKGSSLLAITVTGSDATAIEYASLAQALQESLHLPSYSSGTLQAQALAEGYFGQARSGERALMLFTQQEMSAVQIHPALPPHSVPLAQLGHIQIDPLGEHCHCGRFGCLCTLASEQAIISKVQKLAATGFQTQLAQASLSLKAIGEAAQQGDELALRTLKDATEALAKGLASAINLIAPERIVVAGPWREIWPQIESWLTTSLSRQTHSTYLEKLTFHLSELKAPQAAGALAIVQQALFSGELIQSLKR